MKRLSSTPAARLDAEDRRRVLAAVSLLLGYPDQGLLAQTGALRQLAESTAPPAGPALLRFLAHLDDTSAEALAQEYVDTFDLRRRSCLYLTYYTFGDTLKRGAALVDFAQTYSDAGLEQPAGALPDHLAVVCNFAALAPDQGIGWLARHRAGIEMLGHALAETDSPYLGVIEALRAALPEPMPGDLEKAFELAATGPPLEEVGLEPFAPPEYMGGNRR